MFRFRLRKFEPKIFPDEILMDSSNLPGFDTAHFEGRLEKPITRKTFWVFMAALAVLALFYVGKIFTLQIIQGEKLTARSEKNSFKKERITPLRGAIYDRNGVALAWNGEKKRSYAGIVGLSHLLGYTSLPSAEELKNISEITPDEYVGKDGVEKNYDAELRGVTGIRLMERDSQNNFISESVQTEPQNGKNITLTIDSELQSHLYKLVEATVKERNFEGGAAVIMDANNGEVLAMVSAPEYDSQILSDGGPAESINDFLNDKRKPFINRAISGLYAPGSTVKPFMALAALNEGIISPEKEIYSSGSISVPNPFFPDKKTVFKDWKAHGAVDMRKAIAVSSDVYFYAVGGGYEDVVGLGINKIKEYAQKFGFGSKTGIELAGEQEGVVPSQEIKVKNNPDDPTWRVGDTYISSIGQGYFLATPLEVAVYTAAIANGGFLLKPSIIKKDSLESPIKSRVEASESYFEIAREGMRMAVTEGTAQGLSYPDLKIAAKTGTAEVGGNKKYVHSWLIGFYPYENPKYAFAIVLEKGPAGNTTGSPYVMKQFFDWLKIYHPEYAI